MSIRGYPGLRPSFLPGQKAHLHRPGPGNIVIRWRQCGSSSEKDIGSLLAMRLIRRNRTSISAGIKIKTFSTSGSSVWTIESEYDPLCPLAIAGAECFSASPCHRPKFGCLERQAGVTGYEIYRATQSAGPFSLIREQSGTTIRNTGLIRSHILLPDPAYSTVGDVRFKSNLTTAVAVQALHRIPLCQHQYPSHPTTEATPTSAASATPLVTSIIKPTPSLVPTSTPLSTLQQKQ